MFAYYGPEWESLASRMVGRWCPSFSGNTGLQLPDTTGRNHGTLTTMDSNASWVANSDKLALNFAGGTHRVQMQNIIRWGEPDAFHFSAWINPANLIGTKGFIGVDTNGGGPEFRLNGNQLNFLIQGALNLVTGAGSVSANVWSLVGINYNNRNFAWDTFVNGNRTASGTGPRSFGVDSNTRIQISAATVGDAWTGQIDDVIYFNTALTSSEDRFIFEQGRGGGLLYQPPRRRGKAAAAGFKAYWARRQSQLIGGGL
jgi:hypothetical protein